MVSEKQALRKKEKMITWLIAIAVALALLVAFIVVVKKQIDIPKKVGLENKMVLHAQYWLFREGYTAPVITIENPQDITWQNCEITINGKYIFKIREILSSDNENNIITIDTNDFIRKDGTTFNPTLDSVRSACIICKEPYYGSYCGNFAQ